MKGQRTNNPLITMNYINTETNEVLSENSIRSLYSNTSFPFPFVPPDIYSVVFEVPKPQYNSVTQTVREVAPVLTTKGHYEQVFEIVELYSTQSKRNEAIAVDTELKRKAAVPTSVSPRQIRQALTKANLRTPVEQAIAVSDQDTKDWYEFATEFQRNSPHVTSVGIALGVTELQLDDLWTLAGSL